MTDKLKKEYKQIAKKAGFCFWKMTESGKGQIDWSCDYTIEMNKFSDALIEEVLKEISTFKFPNVDDIKNKEIQQLINNKINEKFNIV